MSDNKSKEDAVNYLNMTEEGREFMVRLNNAASKLSVFTQEERDAFAKAEEDCTCKHCGRCVLAGPPCCYNKVYEMYQNIYREVAWLRKVQSKKDKKINLLNDTIKSFLL